MPVEHEQPTNWNFKGARYHSAQAHQGESGLWYVTVVCGSGRFLDKWEFFIFPPKARFNSYQGAWDPRDVLPMPLCLWQGSGKGGRDRGKPHSSKGGFRPTKDIPYKYEGQEFEGSLLSDGDAFVRQVLGYEPTVEGIKAGIRRDEEEAAKRAAEHEAAIQERLAKLRAEDEEAERKKKVFAELFGQPPVPPGWLSRVTAKGFEVCRDDRWKWDWSHPIFTNLPEYQQWCEEEVARQAKQAIRDAERHAEEAKRQAERDALEQKIAQKIPYVKRRLADL